MEFSKCTLQFIPAGCHFLPRLSLHLITFLSEAHAIHQLVVKKVASFILSLLLKVSLPPPPKKLCCTIFLEKMLKSGSCYLKFYYAHVLLLCTPLLCTRCHMYVSLGVLKLGLPTQNFSDNLLRYLQILLQYVLESTILFVSTQK